MGPVLLHGKGARPGTANEGLKAGAPLGGGNGPARLGAVALPPVAPKASVPLHRRDQGVSLVKGAGGGRQVTLHPRGQAERAVGPPHLLRPGSAPNGAGGRRGKQGEGVGERLAEGVREGEVNGVPPVLNPPGQGPGQGHAKAEG